MRFRALVAAVAVALIGIVSGPVVEADNLPLLPPAPPVLLPLPIEAPTAPPWETLNEPVKQTLWRGGKKVPAFREAISGMLRANITVCTTGCGFTNNLLQSAINSGAAGDFVLTEEDYLYVGNFLLPNHGGGSVVTVRTGVSATGSVLATNPGNFPAAGVRVTAAIADTGNFSKFQSTVANTAAIATKNDVANPSRYWKFQWVDILHNNSSSFGSGVLFRCGNDDSTNQPTIASIPGNITLDQVYLHGHAVKGQHRGIQMNCNDFTLSNSTIEHIKEVTGEGQSLWCNSFTHGLLIQNSTLSGGAEVVMCGGAGGGIHPNVTVAATGRTTTGATFVTNPATSAPPELTVGQGFTINVGGLEEYREVASCGTSTLGDACTANAVTWTTPLSGIPDSPGDVDYGVVPNGIQIIGSTLTRPPSERNDILLPPANVSATAAITGGTLTSGTPKCYKVVARLLSVNNTPARSAASAEDCDTVASGTTGSVTITWDAVTNAESYKVYGRTQGGENIYWTVNAPNLTFTDTGSSGTTENVPSSVVNSGSHFTVKNVLELKNARGVLVSGSILEYSWLDAQTGYCILLTPANTGGGNDSTRLQDVEISDSIIRHCNGGFQITGRDVNGVPPYQASGRTKNILVRNNLFNDIGPQWGASSVHFLLVSAHGPKPLYASTDRHSPIGVKFRHNTIINSGTLSLIYFDLFKTVEQFAEGFEWVDNIGFKGAYGVNGNNSCTPPGNNCFTAHTDSARVWQNDVVCDVVAANYPGGATETLAPTCADLINVHFNDFAAGDFSLDSGSAYNNAATDSTDIGADIAAILTATGGGTGQGSPPAPNIIATPFEQETVGVYRCQSITVEGGTLPLSFAVTTGTLNAGKTLNTATGEICGAATGAGSSTYTITVTDSQAGTPRTDPQEFTMTVVAAPAALNITTTTLTNGIRFASYGINGCVTLGLEGGTGPFEWSATGTVPTGMTVNPDGTYCGIPTSLGAHVLTFRVTDSLGAIDTQEVTHTITAETGDCTRGPAVVNNSVEATSGTVMEISVFVDTVDPATRNPPPCIKVLDEWRNPATSPATIRRANSPSPNVSWVDVATATIPSLFSLPEMEPFNPETMTIPGAVLSGNVAGKFQPVAGGEPGSFLRRSGVTGENEFSTNAGALTNLPAPQLVGTVPVASLPDLDASKITSGVIAAARLPGVIPHAFTIRADGASFNFTAGTIQGAGIMQLDTGHRHRGGLDFTNVTEMRLHALHISGNGNTAILRVEYSTDQTNWTATSIQFTFAAGWPVERHSAWVALPGGMKADVYIRIVATGGDGTEAPWVGNVWIEYR